MASDELAAIIQALADHISHHGVTGLDYILQSAARHRREPFYSKLNEFCTTYHKSFENFNYNISSNGEMHVLNRVSSVIAKAPAPCVFDVGANVGNWTLCADSTCPNARIHCFEICPPTFLQLVGNVRHRTNIITNNCGLSDALGSITIRFFPDYSHVSTATPYPHPVPSVEMTGQVIRGDDYMADHKIQRIDFLKIDVEGMEMNVMNGLASAIANEQVDCIQFEYGMVSIYTKHLLKDFYALLTSHGYMVGKIYPNYVDFREYNTVHEDFIGPNYLAVRKRRIDLIEVLST